MKQKTAMMELIDHLSTSRYYHKLINDIQSRNTVIEPNIFDRFLEKEKEQIMDANRKGIAEGLRRINNSYYDKIVEPTDYYNETYKQD